MMQKKKLKIVKKTKGITLIALVITIILLLILGGVVVSQLSSGNLIGNAISVADKSKIESKKEEIKLAIIGKMAEADGDITIDEIIDELEKKGIIDSGNSNSENGQVKTNPDGYVYEIVEDKNGNWDVNYVGKGEISEVKVTLSASVNTTGVTNKVIITVTAKAKAGIKSITMPDGTSKTYASGTTTATENYEVTQNGTYKFTATNNKNESEETTVAISNILEEEITISAISSTPTNQNVTVTITWPSGNYSATKEVSIDGGKNYTSYTGTTTQLTINANCNIRARIRNASGEIKTKTLEIINIDKTNPTVTVKQTSVTITEGDSNEISSYFTVVANGTYGIASKVYTDTSNNNAVVTNTNTLAEGTHTIKCTATKETGATANASMTIVVESISVIEIEEDSYERYSLSKVNDEDALNKCYLEYYPLFAIISSDDANSKALIKYIEDIEWCDSEILDNMESVVKYIINNIKKSTRTYWYYIEDDENNANGIERDDNGNYIISLRISKYIKNPVIIHYNNPRGEWEIIRDVEINNETNEVTALFEAL